MGKDPRGGGAGMNLTRLVNHPQGVGALRTDMQLKGCLVDFAYICDEVES